MENLTEDELIDHLEKLKAETAAKADKSEKVLLEAFGFDVKNDLPPEVHSYFDTLAINNQISGLNDDFLPDELEAKLASLDLRRTESKLKRQVKAVDPLIQNLKEENAHLSREVEKRKKESESLEDDSLGAFVESEQLRAKLERYTKRLQNMQSHDIASKCEEVKHLREKSKRLKKDIAQAERKLKVYCGLPPNIEQAKEAINRKKVELESAQKVVHKKVHKKKKK